MKRLAAAGLTIAGAFIGAGFLAAVVGGDIAYARVSNWPIWWLVLVAIGGAAAAGITLIGWMDG